MDTVPLRMLGRLLATMPQSLTHLAWLAVLVAPLAGLAQTALPGYPEYNVKGGGIARPNVNYCARADGSNNADPCQYSASGLGSDASANAPSLSSLSLLTSFTVANPGQYRVTNECTSTVLVAFGQTGNQTIIALGAAAASGGQGGDTSPEIPWYTGPVAVYGAAGCPVAARHN